MFDGVCFSDGGGGGHVGVKESEKTDCTEKHRRGVDGHFEGCITTVR